MTRRLLVILALLVGATSVVGGCIEGGLPHLDPELGGGHAVVSKDGLTLAVELDRTDVAPGGEVVARVTLRNDRRQEVEYQSTGCRPVVWTVKLRLPVAPEGRAWPGIAGEFKKYALTQGFGPGGVPALQPVDTSPPFPPCQVEPGRTVLGPGAAREWRITWQAEIVAGVPALSGEAPFTISLSYDPDRQAAAAAGGMGILPLRFQTWQQIGVDGTLRIVGDAPRPLSGGEAIDIVLADARFASWLAEQPPASWANANLFLQSWPKDEGIVPAGPSWNVELFREPRNWAIAFVQPHTGRLELNFCNIPCDR